MGYKDREIEKKYLVPDGNYEDTVALVKSSLNKWDKLIENGSNDFYWKVPVGLIGDFIRLRYLPEGKGQLTVKHADKETNVNRVEIDVVVENPDEAKKFLVHVMGEPIGKLYKEYTVFFIKDEFTTISVYRVRGDKRIFLEVEAKTVAHVDKLSKTLNKAIPLDQQEKSLYQIFFGDKK